MPKPTLKLPAQPRVSGAFGEAKPSFRKPVRGGSKTARPSAAQQAEARAAKSVRQKPANEDATNAPGSLSPQHEPDGAIIAESRAIPTTPAAPRPAKPSDTPKVYPKRGIARSTGARALPPMRKPEAPRPPSPAPDAPRLSKRLCEMTQCSRREADEWIENGWVRVDGLVVTKLGARARPDARIEVNEAARKHRPESVTILLNKPLAAKDQGETPHQATRQWIRAENRWTEDDSQTSFKATHLRGLTQVGRLDAESTGMLVFTQEASVTRRISGDDSRLEKEFMVRVQGELSAEGLKRLNIGLSLDEEKLKRAQVSWQNEGLLRFVLHENRPNQIRRMCELVGLRVISVKLIRIGSVSLGKLPVGKWRYLRQNERF